MYLSELRLANFGPFVDQHVKLPATGICVISGPNGSGKSQLIGAALAAIAGKAAIGISHGGEGPAEIELSVVHERQREVARVCVAADAREIARVDCSVRSPEDSPLALIETLRSSLASNAQPKLLLDDVYALRTERLSRNAQGTIDGIARGVPELGYWDQLKADGWLDAEFQSAGLALLAALLGEVAYRIESGSDLPLIVDGVLESLDMPLGNFATRLLEAIGTHTQVILIASHRLRCNAALQLELPPMKEPHRSIAYYQRLTRAWPSAATKKSRPSGFRSGDTFPLVESRVCELKEVRGSNALGSITGIVDQYVVAFLNAGTKQVGSIFWGVRDSDRKIIGVELTESQCDQLKRAIVEKVHKITPTIAPSSFSVVLHAVGDPDSTTLYVVEVRVPAINGRRLYATGGEQVFVKTDAGKQKLSIAQIQEEVLLRASWSDPSQ